MNGWSNESILKIIKKDMSEIRNRSNAFKDFTDKCQCEFKEYLSSLKDQVRLSVSGPLIPKTPKVPKKKNVQRIETIPEDDVVQNSLKIPKVIVEPSSNDEQEDETATTTRTSRRAASLRASSNIKKQQTLKLNDKLRQPSVKVEDTPLVQKTVRVAKQKKIKSISSDEEETKIPAKKNSEDEQRTKNNVASETITKIESDQTYFVKEQSIRRSSRSSRNKRPRDDDDNDENIERQKTSKKSQEPAAKKANIGNSTMDIPESDMTTEPSMYEDAVGKSIPMNSTMNPNTTVTFDRKMMNVTVVLEAMQMPMSINETVTLKKTKSTGSNHSSRRDTLVNEEPQTIKVMPGSPRVPKPFQSKSTLQDRMKALKETMENKEFNALITDDESSPEPQREQKKTRKIKKPEIKTKQRTTRSSLMSEDDDVVLATPTKTVLRDVNGITVSKNPYKTNALFSPWAKDSVKKRVEAFEQAQLNSPKSVEIDAPTRQTRTKTRAMAAAEANANQPDDTSIAQKVARETSRKSLAKAKKIALAKEMRENDERKENNAGGSAQKPSRLLATNDKLAQKQQLRITPVSKSRLQMPMSVNRIHHTPAGSQIVNPYKAQTATKGNIITSVDTFLSQPKTLTKTNSTDSLVEKKRKINDEDAKRKRDEALKAKIEEKKRKREEKEMRNKLAREYNEKMEMEKRLKQEREREEKARLAQSLQEKQREEFEKKRLLQLQRAQEKEERRKQEEQLRLQRVQEQEEAERQLAEQKRREQEAERRRQIEARAQNLIAAEAAKMKAQVIAKAKLASKQQQAPISYKLDSEPDDDDSDNETAPKNPLPYWALPHVRKTQLKIDHYIPMSVVRVFFGAQRCTPDLTELFHGIKKERLQRTSSAIWKTPPRYSMMMDDKDE